MEEEEPVARSLMDFLARGRQLDLARAHSASSPPPPPPPPPPPRERSRTRSRSPRRRYDDRDRSRSRDRYRRDRRDRSPANGNNHYDNRGSAPARGTYETKEQMLSNIKESSQQERRVYVGNLSYDVKWHVLKDFMRQAGEVVFADVLLLPNGMSKGCGIVEYATREQAQQAINTLSNQNLMGRLIYDRETEPRFSGGPGAGRGGFDGGYAARGGFGGGRGGFGGAYGGGGGGGNQIFVQNLPFQVGWQDLKDLFRQAVMTGTLLRADVHMTPDGHPKGTGIVVFDNPDDAQNAIQQFNGYDWQGRLLEVREDRYAGTGGFGPRGGFGGGFGGRGGFGGGYGGRGAYGGGFGGPRGGFGGGYGGRGGFGGGFGGRGGYGGPQGGLHGPSAPAANLPPPNPFVDGASSGGPESATIFVRNLPWSTSNEDLVELFQTIGPVERAEIKMESNMRSSGTGVVEFQKQEDAATSIAKFTGYQYGGRPLGLSYVRYAGQEAGMEGMEGAGSMQEQMM